MPTSTVTSRVLDRVARLDPGRAAWRRAVTATASLGAALVAGYGYSTLIAPAHGAALPMITSGVMAMQTSSAMAHPVWATRLRVALWAPLFFGSGLLIHSVATALGGIAVEIVAFALMTFIAVSVRRFGPDFSVLGLTGWTGFFISAFAAPSLAETVILLGGLPIAACVTFAVSILLRPHRPQNALAHVLRAWTAQTDAILADAEAILRQTNMTRRRRAAQRILNRSRHLTEISLLADGWLGQAASFPKTTPHSIRSHLFRMHTAVDTVVRTACDAADRLDDLRARAVHGIVSALARHDSDLAITRSNQLLDGRESVDLALFATDAIALATLRRDDPTSDEHLLVEFVPAASMAPDGSLGGSASIAPMVRPRGGPRTASWHLATRQAVQASLAVAIAAAAGLLLSVEHYTWAALTAFIIFLGTSTRGDITAKAIYRAIGTLTGMVLAIPIVLATGAHPIVVIGIALLCCAVGYYLMSVSYVYLMLCTSLAVSEMYNIMGQFNSAFAAIRIAEVLVGSIVAVLVATLVVPISTTDAITHARQQLFRSIRELLNTAAGHIHEQRPVDHHEMLRMGKLVEEHTRQLSVVAAPLRVFRRGRSATDIRVALRKYDEYCIHTRRVVSSLPEHGAGGLGECADLRCRLHESLEELSEKLNIEMKPKKAS